MLPNVNARRAAFSAIPALLTAIVLLSSSASANEDEFTTTLHPGWNLIGWIHAETSSSALFEQIPELVRIVDAAGTTAARDDPDAQGSLRSLLSGEGYWFRLEAEAPVDWRRQADSQAGPIDVAAGVSLAPWAGGNNVPIGEALSGLGDSLEIAWRWDPAAQEYRSWFPGFDAPYVDDLPIRTGQALLLDMNSAASWEQTGVDYPTFQFSPRFPLETRRALVADTRLVIERFDHLLSIVADLDRLQFNLHSPDDPELPWQDDRLYNFFWDPTGHRLHVEMLVPRWMTTAEQLGLGSPRQYLSFAYFWAIPFLLAADRIEQVPLWFRYAGPLWAEHSDPDNPFDIEWLGNYSVPATQYVLADQPTHVLASINNADDPYAWSDPTDPVTQIGGAVALWLVERHGARSLMDFWRHFAAQDDDQIDWFRAFEETFGQSVDVFYDEYNQSVREQYPAVRGKIVAPSWIRLDRLALTAHSVPPGTSVDVPITFYGDFRAALPTGVDMRFALSLPRAFCSGFGTADGEIVLTRDVPLFQVGDEGPTDITVTIPNDFCSTFIGGQIIDLDDNPVEGLTVQACPEGASCAEVSTDKDGRFHILTTGEFEFYLRLTDPIENCSLYYRKGGTTNADGSRSAFVAGPGSSWTVQIRVPPSLCWAEITGVLPNLPETAPRMPLLGFASNLLEVSAIDWDDGTVYHGIITQDGRWTIAVPTQRHYQLRFGPRIVPSGSDLRGCTWLHREGDFDSIYVGSVSRVEIAAELPQDFCR